MSHSGAYTPPPHTGLEIIYQDKYLVAACKPAGLLSVPGRGEDKLDSLAVRVQAEFPDALVAHRLDRDTSGIILFPRGAKMHRTLSMMFEKRQLDKSYVAVVQGKLEPAQGEVQLPLCVDWPNRPLHIVDHANGKPAHTKFAVLEYDARTDRTRVALEPVTGRTHQLRVHMQALGHPIVGDSLYGGNASGNEPRLLLHARTLSFLHPVTAKPVDLVAEAPF